MIRHEVLLQPETQAIDILERELIGATQFDAASAFVTRSGVELISGLPRPERFRLICRAGHGPTAPNAVAMAADELGARVRIVAGPAAGKFHPKLYLVSQAQRLVVLTGSGNLTAGGLSKNVEQFELLLLPRGHEAESQMQRFEEIWARGTPLEQLRPTAFWDAWCHQWADSQSLRERAEILDRELDTRLPPPPTASPTAKAGPQWRQEEVFPEIARAVRRLSGSTSVFVTRDEIASALVEDPAARNLIEEARTESGYQPWAVAGNMVDWFSARFESTPWAARLQRERRRSRSPATGKLREIWAYARRVER